jgi:ribosomal protein S12 methylthiotransferase accessory factor
MGITSSATSPGLIASAFRSLSRSDRILVRFGIARRGHDLPQAMTSALMEACEGFHAEEIGPCRRAAYADLAQSETVVDLDTLCPGIRSFEPAAAISWIEGYDLLRREPCWVPAEIVHTDYTGEPDGYFLAGSNGLASGNHLVEAINAALYEVVERDAVALWAAQPILRRARCALDLASVDDPDCGSLLAKYAAAGIDVVVAIQVARCTSRSDCDNAGAGEKFV